MFHFSSDLLKQQEMKRGSEMGEKKRREYSPSYNISKYYQVTHFLALFLPKNK